jgi:hypothetical protein
LVENAKTTGTFSAWWKRLHNFCPNVSPLLEKDYFNVSLQQNKVFIITAADYLCGNAYLVRVLGCDGLLVVEWQ